MIGLLDCGAYYVEGFATDTTRAVFCPAAGKSPEAWQKKIYTVVLKGMLAVQHAEFDRELVGNQLDLYARNVCAAYGYDYLHGTGHGIGIHVHEGGHRIGKVSLGHLAENGVISLEPGIYLAGQGGVRLENCAVVRAHPTDVKRYMFQNLTFVGFDWDLIDVSLLNAREKVWLKDYEKKCVELGTQVTPCPL
jgi:Xaa-Pro aminopeptidase